MKDKQGIWIMRVSKEIKKNIEEQLRPLKIHMTIDKLRDQIWQHVEKGGFSTELSKSLQKMAETNSSIGVLKTCFEIVEHSILLPIANLYNSAYVESIFQQESFLNEQQDSLMKLEKRLRELESVRSMSFGHKVEGVRSFMQNSKLLLPCLKLGEEKSKFILDTDFRGFEEHEVFIVRATQMLSTLTVASGYKVPSNTLGKYISDQNPIGEPIPVIVASTS